MNSRIPKIAAVAACAVWLALPAPASADPPPWAPAHGYRAKQYRYVYYPSYEVYYAPESRLWFWFGDSGWRFGASLPAGVIVDDGPGVSIMLSSPRPYVEHGYVVERYGGRHHHRHHDDD